MVATSDFLTAAPGFDPNANGLMPQGADAEMPTDVDEAAPSDGYTDAEAATEATDDATDTQPDAQRAAIEAEIRQQLDADFASFKANYAQIKDREVAQSQLAIRRANDLAALHGAENQILHQFVQNAAAQGFIPEAEVYKFQLGLRDAKQQVATQQAEQYQQTQQQSGTAQQFEAYVPQRHKQRADELGYGDEGLRQLLAQPTFQGVVNAYKRSAYAYFRNPNEDTKTAMEAAGAVVLADEERFAAAYKQQPGVKRASANLAKGAARGPQSTATRAGGASAPVFDADAVSKAAWTKFPSDEAARISYFREQQASSVPAKR